LIKKRWLGGQRGAQALIWGAAGVVRLRGRVTNEKENPRQKNATFSGRKTLERAEFRAERQREKMSSVPKSEMSCADSGWEKKVSKGRKGGLFPAQAFRSRRDWA